LTRSGNLPDAVRYLSRATDTWRDGLAGSTYLMAVMEEQALARILRGELSDAQKLLDEAGVIRAKSGSHATNLKETLKRASSYCCPLTIRYPT
jgi:hypothetical protein